MTPEKMRQKLKHQQGWREHPHGLGSTDDAVAQMQQWFPSVVAEYGIRTVADVGCGQTDWFPKDGIEYQGFDLVPFNEGTRTFDITTKQLPGNYDLIVMRYVLNHLPNNLAARALENIQGHSRYFMMSMFDKQEKAWKKDKLLPLKGWTFVDSFPDHDGRKEKRMELYRSDTATI